ncbi:DUF4116 domain-containing protein [Legionella clemsonensis]|uniref:Uncharacterized protein n=1 Tax=Legionella clemsonensis TaxID=1867846 RepID=A0A222P6E4_9GAMM|nr:DUF4116 domain-containing protein [Legionella clemsonensis]ASQ47421.1 hypothetical protein clem_14475 [Legionella clemsonensis]
MSTPKEHLTIEYDSAATAIRGNPKVLKAFISLESLSVMQKQQLCLLAVQLKWSIIYQVPEDLLNDDIIIACLEQSSDYIQDIAPQYVTPKLIEVVANTIDDLEFVPPCLRTPAICLSGVRKHWQSMDMVPDDDAFHTVYLTGIEKNWRAFFYLPEQRREDPVILEALKKAWLSKELPFPEPFDMQRLCIIAIEQDPDLLSRMPQKILNKEICFTALKKKIGLLEYIPEELRLEVCTELVRHYSMALGNLPPRLRKTVIEKIGPDKILANDFQSFSLLSAYRGYEQTILQTITTWEHVVVTKPEAFYIDAEIHDSYLVYANANKRANKTVHVDAPYVRACLDRLRNNKTINLVLLGHDPMFETERRIGGLHYLEIIELLKEYPNINRITLLTCNSVKVELLEEEKKINQRLVERELALFSPCALLLMISVPDEEKSAAILATSGNTQAFILIKQEENYSLLYLRQEAAVIKHLQISLSRAEMSKLHKTIYPNGKKLPFPANTGGYNYIRGGHGREPLEKKQFLAFYRTIFQKNLYSKTNPNYKTNKQYYSFFNNIRMDEGEYSKLKNSLLKTIVDRIREEKFDRVIDVKGYNYALLVDTLERLFIAGIRTSAYQEFYKKKNQALFFESLDNLIREVVEKERDKTVNRILTQVSPESEDREESESLSQVKAVIYRVYPRFNNS